MMMSTELIQEFQLLQNSRANKFADDMADRISSSVDAVHEIVSSSLSKRGSMLIALDSRLNFKIFRNLKRRFFKQ
ncbi:hypothetical protein EZ449_15145 [Pedobacter frigidisoli]|uniref:Uncharacterized protein n=1 Tax=Pedobacter frigidisoli TaxID=2530455 RepID=A0A4R0NZA2_9SPHI|nr:hypothetical protein [Pedobacter frigidisoli]TCD07123.1 hypothetical protein EZ449_15145 [Pedobacter frigidisoli]